MSSSESDDSLDEPYVEILEQPNRKAQRFRYAREGRSGSIVGAKSTTYNKSYPTIQLMNYSKKAIVVMSCVTKDHPYRPHPYEVVGKDCLNKGGVCTREIMGNVPIILSNVGIQCVKVDDMTESLTIREKHKIDPFRTGFEHKKRPENIDATAIRLCFQVFIEGNPPGRYNIPLKPVVTQPIFDKKGSFELTVVALSPKKAPANGGQLIIILCERIVKDDIEVRFFEENQYGTVLWEGFGEFQPSDIHKHYGLCIISPKYKDPDIQQPKEIFVELRRPSDGAKSKAHPFLLLPKQPKPCRLKKVLAQRKKTKVTDDDCKLLEPLRDSPRMDSPDFPPTPEMSIPSLSENQPQSHRPYAPDPMEISEPCGQQSQWRSIGKSFMQSHYRLNNPCVDLGSLESLCEIPVSIQEGPLEELDETILQGVGIEENISGTFSGLSIT